MSGPPGALLRRLEAIVDDTVEALGGVGGGCINEAASIRVGGQRLFLKWTEAAPPGFFEAEADGLRRLGAAAAVRVPAPLFWGEPEGGAPAFLVMDHVEGLAAGQGFDRAGFGARFGAAMAALHAPGGESYGLERDNFIGALAQENGARPGWVSFFGEARLGAQVRLARAQGKLRGVHIDKVERLIERLPGLIPDDPGASLLHGDLWSGNYMIGGAGEPVLVDPAVYRGHREAEIAFTELFGGFPQSFYAAYRAALPLEPGYEGRRDLYNAYPLLVHVNLFGGGYVRQLMGVVERYL